MQLRELRGYIKRSGWKIYKEFIDQGYTGANTLDELGHLSIDFISYDNNLDTSSPTGKLVFQIIGAVAEFEKDIIRERVVAGLKNARQKGKRLGRPPITDIILQKAKDLQAQGLSLRKIEKKLGVGEGTIRKRLNQ